MKTRTGPGFYLMLLAIMVATFAVHEAGHWLTALLLGHEPFYGLNGAGTHDTVSTLHEALISAAGPAVTVLQGLVAFVLIRGGAGLTAFAVLYCAAFMRLMAAGISLIVHLNDEARVSVALGLPPFTLHLLVAGGLIVLTVVAGIRLKLSWRAWIFSWLVGSAAVSAIVYLDMAMKG